MTKQIAGLVLAGAIACAAGTAAAQTQYQGQQYQGQMQPPPGGPMGQGGAMPPEMQAMMHQAAMNQLGVLEYCRGKGYVGDDVLQLQRQQIAGLPQAQSSGLDQAEAMGRQGIVQAGGQQLPLAQAAQTHGTTEAALCGQIGGMLRQQSTELQNPDAPDGPAPQ